ncbi:DNA-binding response regulator [Streptomyces sp. SAJ15]|uniref:DNA-binding response regulator n=1 Tax=Streptomyces sp. SAJ15 TaxID=2011095 RepID=UPI0021B22A42|nr:DNA-binding response regulator [Streptomyces sp. SAJ15]
MGEHRDRQARHALVAGVAMADAAVLAAAEQVVEGARRGVYVVLPAAGARLAAVHAGLAELAARVEEPRELRLLCARPPAGWARRYGAGRVRIAAVPLPTLVVADGRTALVCAVSTDGGRDGGRAASVVEDPSVVGALHAMLRSVWGGATPAAGPLDGADPARAEMVRRVLERLRDGVTDEAAARELAVSVRTYRRYVTGILDLLGAGSRFQAGVLASELGILPDR